MERKEFTFDGEKYLQGEFVLLNGQVDVQVGMKWETKYLLNEQAYFQVTEENKAYLSERYQWDMDQLISEDKLFYLQKPYVFKYVVEEGKGTVSKANIYEYPPKGCEYVPIEKLKPKFTTEWIICIFFMVITAMFEPVCVWSILILIGFLIYRHAKVKEYQKYKQKERSK